MICMQHKIRGIIIVSFPPPQDTASVFSSVPQVQQKCLFPDWHNSTDLSCTLNQSSMNETVGFYNRASSFLVGQANVGRLGLQMAADSSHLGDSVSYGEIQVNKIDTSGPTKPPLWPTVRLVLMNRLISDNICMDVNKVPFFSCDLKEKTPRRTVISRGRLTWSSEDVDSLGEDLDQASIPKKMKLARMNSQEKINAQIKNSNREGQETKRSDLHL